MTDRSVLSVQGMTCGGCEKNIEFALCALAGVEAVQADHRTGKITITFDSAVTSSDRVREAIEDIGYDVVGRDGAPD